MCVCQYFRKQRVDDLGRACANFQIAIISANVLATILLVLELVHIRNSNGQLTFADNAYVWNTAFIISAVVIFFVVYVCFNLWAFWATAVRHIKRVIYWMCVELVFLCVAIFVVVDLVFQARMALHWLIVISSAVSVGIQLFSMIQAWRVRKHGAHLIPVTSVEPELEEVHAEPARVSPRHTPVGRQPPPVSPPPTSPTHHSHHSLPYHPPSSPGTPTALGAAPVSPLHIPEGTPVVYITTPYAPFPSLTGQTPGGTAFAAIPFPTTVAQPYAYPPTYPPPYGMGGPPVPPLFTQHSFPDRVELDLPPSYNQIDAAAQHSPSLVVPAAAAVAATVSPRSASSGASGDNLPTRRASTSLQGPTGPGASNGSNGLNQTTGNGQTSFADRLRQIRTGSLADGTAVGGFSTHAVSPSSPHNESNMARRPHSFTRPHPIELSERSDSGDELRR